MPSHVEVFIHHYAGPVSSNVHGDQLEFLERPSGVASGDRSIITSRAISQSEFRDGNREYRGSCSWVLKMFGFVHCHCCLGEIGSS